MNAGTAAVQSKKILVVDDNEIVLKSISYKLRGAGYEPVTALDGLEALAKVRREAFDLILLDINFPPDIYGDPWDGFRILSWIRQVESARNLPVIIISSSEAEEDKERAQRDGITAFFRKPIDHADLLKVIGETLELAPAAAI